MKDRIREIMEYENLTPSIFADKLKIGRAVMSHILNGRNNPSLDVVTRILETMDYIDADWLLSGKGEMLRSDSNVNQTTSEIDDVEVDSHNAVPISISSDLFPPSIAQEPITPPIDVTNKEVKESMSSVQPPIENKPISTPFIPPLINKKISKVIIYYSDNTFEAFNPNSSPL